MELPLGSGTVEVDLGPYDVTIAEPTGSPAIDVASAAEVAMNEPNDISLQEIVSPTDDVCIVVTDVTRAVPDDILLELLVDRLIELGVDRERIAVVIGLGLHRPMDREEIESMLGSAADLARNHDPSATRQVGEVDGCEITINTTVIEADTVLSTGVVEPHQYAGFSGGAKTVVIGAGGESQISFSHGPDMLSRSGVRLGRIEGNPFRTFLDKAGDLVGLDFCLNLTHGPNGVLGVEAGSPRAVVTALTETARDALSVEIRDRYDAVIAGVGAPKDANLYQASRAATYIALGDVNPLRSGGTLVIPATLTEGAGEGTGEQRFYDRLAKASDADTLYRELATGYEAGAQRAFVLADVLRSHEVVITNAQSPEIVEDCLMSAAPSIPDAISTEEKVLVVPDALNTLLRQPGR